ncbi:ABC transporter permease [Clostridium neuense]|uniref:ABC transporter permease n=1 Tax=Clostridium neuense TaxID=1728934 RepID=A0ABW8TEE0_9CLOT
MKVNTTVLVFKKEITDMFRDRKTIIMSVLLPILLLPLLSLLLGTFNSSQNKIKQSVKTAVVDKGQSSFGEFLKSQKNIKIVKSGDIKKDIKDGKILVAVTIPKDFDEKLKSDLNTKLTLSYDDSSADADTATEVINAYVQAYSKQIVASRLSKKNINPDILTPINIVKDEMQKGDGKSAFLVTMLIPMLLMLYGATSTIAPSVDLGAGEKERGTLEPLLTTKASRMSILWGKLMAISTMGIIMSLASLLGVYLTMKQKNGMFGDGKGINLDTATFILIIIIPILTTVVFGAIELAISIYARSFKEAQTYLSPITIIAMVLVYAVMMKDAKSIETFYFNIPITNATCLMKEFLVGIHNYTHIAMTFGWMVVYIVGALLLARYMFSREEVIFRS